MLGRLFWAIGLGTHVLKCQLECWNVGGCSRQAQSASLGNRHHSHHQASTEHRPADLVLGAPAVDRQQLHGHHFSSIGGASCLCLLPWRLQAQEKAWRGNAMHVSNSCALIVQLPCRLCPLQSSIAKRHCSAALLAAMLTSVPAYMMSCMYKNLPMLPKETRGSCFIMS